MRRLCVVLLLVVGLLAPEAVLNRELWFLPWVGLAYFVAVSIVVALVRRALVR